MPHERDDVTCFEFFVCLLNDPFGISLPVIIDEVASPHLRRSPRQFFHARNECVRPRGVVVVTSKDLASPDRIKIFQQASCLRRRIFVYWLIPLERIDGVSPQQVPILEPTQCVETVIQGSSRVVIGFPDGTFGRAEIFWLFVDSSPVPSPVD